MAHLIGADRALSKPVVFLLLTLFSISSSLQDSIVIRTTQIDTTDTRKVDFSFLNFTGLIDVSFSMPKTNSIAS
jgi:hypothetical protein